MFASTEIHPRKFAAGCHVGMAAAAAMLVASAAHTAEPAVAAIRKCAVDTHRNITYVEIPHDPERKRHRLDVYSPREQTKRPVLFFVHGGAWVIGCKDDVFGIYGYGTIAKCLAERGLVVVMPNYRLSPGVQHPEHVKDVARAFAWTCRNIAEYGGDPERIFVCGHSAGGHLVSLMTTDPTYLKAADCSPKNIRGVIALSGVYNLTDFNLDLNLSVTVTGKCMSCKAEIHPLEKVFGTDPEVLKQASPITHVRPGLPPFLLVNGGLDYCPMRKTAKEFAAALKDKGCEVESRLIDWRTHETMVFDIPHLTAEPKMTDIVVDFIEKHK